MESFGLYEDLSLFSGDLLVGINPLADELPTLEQDGCAQESSMFPIQMDPFRDELIKPPKFESTIFNDDWMEKKSELINLFSSSNVQITIQDSSPDIIQACPLPNVEVEPQSPMGADSVSYVELAPMSESGLKTPEELLQSVSEYLTSDLDDSTSSANVSFGDLSMDNFSTADGLASLLSEEDLKILSKPILSPVSPQDVEYILSAGPSSPCSTASVNDSVVPQIIAEGYILSIEEPAASPCSSIDLESSQSADRGSIGPVRPVRSARTKKYSPYESLDEDYEEPKKSSKSPRSFKTPDRKERKKQQNKDAALRYRMKKRNEQHGVFEECDELEKKNEDLKDKVDSMTNEIQYLKDLLLEVYKAKGIQPKGLLVKKSK